MFIWERLSNRAIVTSAVAVVAMAAVGAIALQRTVSVGRTIASLADDHFPATVLLSQIAQGRVDLERAATAAFAASQMTKLRDDLYGEVDIAVTVLDEGVRSFSDQHGASAGAKAEWAEVVTSTQDLHNEVTRLMAALKARDALPAGASPQDPAHVKALEAWSALRAASAAADKRILAFQTRAAASVQAAKTESLASTRSAVVTIGIALLVAVLAVAAGGVILTVSIRGTVAALVAESRTMVEAVSNGELDVRCRPEAVSTEFRTVVEGMNGIFAAFVQPLRLTAETIDRIASGAIPEKVSSEDYRGEFDAILQNLNRCIDAVNALVADASALSSAAVEGQLSTRADPSRHQGDFRKVIEGVNATLDAFVHPLQVSAQAVDQIAHGQMPAPIREEWRGDFAQLRDNLNTCVAAIEGVLRRMGEMAEAQARGEIHAVIDETAFQGSYRQLAAGVNAGVQMHVANQLKVLDVLAAYAAGDFSPVLERLKGEQQIANQRLDLLRANLTAVASEVRQLAEAAVEGRLSARADTSRLAGDWKRLAESVNATLDALAAPVDEANQVLQQLERRDLTARMTGQYRGDHVRIKDSLNNTATALHDALIQVAAAAEQVQGASAQIASSSQSVASGASQQAASLEETTSAIESVASSAQQSADNAQRADVLARTARAAADEGAGAVTDLKAAVVKIRAAAEGTSQIIKDVSEIAFQTNLLALNAAVEAARAGEAGRGFAVVAEEVRSLALRAKEAAGKTEELIRQSVRQADEGTVASERVESKLTEIVDGIGKVTDIVGEIAVAAREQSTGIGQVTSTANELDKLTHQNAASAEESSSAASELSGQAEELSSMVSSFRLEQRAGGGPPSTAAVGAARLKLLRPASPAKPAKRLR